MQQLREFRSNFRKIYLATVALLSHDSRVTSVRVSHDVPTNVAYFLFHSHGCRAKVRDKVRKTVARNSHASEILALSKTLYEPCHEKTNNVISEQL